jgi:hypothetical protein
MPSPHNDVYRGFVLDLAENPHPKMLKRALKLRARTAVVHSPSDDHTWRGYEMCMCDATGWTVETLRAYLDSHDEVPS